MNDKDIEPTLDEILEQLDRVLRRNDKQAAKLCLHIFADWGKRNQVKTQRAILTLKVYGETRYIGPINKYDALCAEQCINCFGHPFCLAACTVAI